MPFGEALFWMGITVLGTGLYVVWDRHLKSWWWSAILIFSGFAVVVYSVYAHNHPEAKLPAPSAPPVWVYLLLLTWCAIGYDIYDRKRTNRQSKVLNQPSPVEVPFYGRNTGFRIEAAQFAAHGDEPMNVKEKVRQRVTDGEKDVPVNWNYLIGPRPGDDPHPFVEKFLTLTFSITGRENWEPIPLPNGVFRKALEDLSLQLKQLQNDDKNNEIEYLDGATWRTKVSPLERLAMRAFANLQVVRMLSPLVVIRVAHLDNLRFIEMLHEVDKLKQLPPEAI